MLLNRRAGQTVNKSVFGRLSARSMTHHGHGPRDDSSVKPKLLAQAVKIAGAVAGA